MPVKYTQIERPPKPKSYRANSIDAAKAAGALQEAPAPKMPIRFMGPGEVIKLNQDEDWDPLADEDDELPAGFNPAGTSIPKNLIGHDVPMSIVMQDFANIDAVDVTGMSQFQVNALIAANEQFVNAAKEAKAGVRAIADQAMGAVYAVPGRLRHDMEVMSDRLKALEEQIAEGQQAQQSRDIAECAVRMVLNMADGGGLLETVIKAVQDEVKRLFGATGVDEDTGKMSLLLSAQFKDRITVTARKALAEQQALMMRQLTIEVGHACERQASEALSKYAGEAEKQMKQRVSEIVESRISGISGKWINQQVTDRLKSAMEHVAQSYGTEVTLPAQSGKPKRAMNLGGPEPQEENI